MKRIRCYAKLVCFPDHPAQFQMNIRGVKCRGVKQVYCWICKLTIMGRWLFTGTLTDFSIRS